jgi:intracellular septation protein
MNGFGYTLRYFTADLIPMILFVVIFMVTQNIMLATGIGIAVGLGQLIYALARRRPIGALQWASVGLVLVLGTATMLTHSPLFIMFKPTIINLLVAVVMLRPGWMERYVPAEWRERVRPTLTAFGFVWAGLMVALGAFNAVLALSADPLTWARFHLIVPPVAMIGLFAFQNVYMRRLRPPVLVSVE